MATQAQILDFETQFDSCFTQALSGLGMPILTYQSTQQALVPRCEVKIQIGTAQSNRGGIAAISGTRTTGYLFEFTATIDVFTTRLDNEDARPIMGMIRAAMLPIQAKLNAAGLLPYLIVVALDEVSNARGVFNSDGQKADTFTIVYQGLFGIAPAFQATLVT